MIRLYLKYLVDEPDLARWDQQIGDLVRAAHAGEDVDGRLRAVFARDPEVQAWVADTLSHPDLLPRDIADQLTTRSESPDGDRLGARLQIYTCPVSQCVKWPRLYPSEVVPRCPDHHEVLVEVFPR
ncbi:hypothetical protein [Actinoplanes derwentensis]|nr:hypothetical protein [Actinoplanes derwentensis]